MQPAEFGKPIKAISIDLTESCSLRCTYCFCDTLAPKSDGNHLDIKTGKEIIDWFYDDKVSGKLSKHEFLHIDWWGGEPFIRFDTLKELVNYCNQKSIETNKRMTFSATTNIVSLNKEKIDFVIDNQFSMLYSIDGIGERNKYRLTKSGKNSWDIVARIFPMIVEKYQQMIKDKKEHQPGPSVRLTISPDTLDGLMEDCRELCNMGAESIICSENFDVSWTEEQYHDLYNEYDKILAWQIEELKNNNVRKIRIIDKMLENMCRYIGTGIGNQEKHACGAGNTYLGVSIKGSLYPCHRENKHHTNIPDHEKERCLGNIYDSITNIALFKHLSDVKNIHEYEDSIIDKTKCKDCNYNQLCVGMHCFAVTRDKEGIWNKSTDDQCRIYNIRANLTSKYLILLTASNLLNNYKIMMNIKPIKEDRINNGTLENPCLCNASFYNDTVGLIKNHFLHKVPVSDKTTILMIARDLIDKKIIQENKETEFPKFNCHVYSSYYNEDNIRHLSRELSYRELLDVLTQVHHILEE